MSSFQFDESQLDSVAGATEAIPELVDPGPSLAFKTLNFGQKSPLWDSNEIEPEMNNAPVTRHRGRNAKARLVLDSWRYVLLDKVGSEGYGEKEVQALQRISRELKEGFNAVWEMARARFDGNEHRLLESLFKGDPLVEPAVIDAIMKPRLKENQSLFTYKLGPTGPTRLRTAFLKGASDWPPMAIHQLGLMVSFKSTLNIERQPVMFGFSYGICVYKTGIWEEWLCSRFPEIQTDEEYFRSELSSGRCHVS